MSSPRSSAPSSRDSAAPSSRDSASDLRRSLLAPPAPAGPATPPRAPSTAPAAARAATREEPAPPGPEELLEAAPAVRRLCDSYHRTHQEMRARGRGQRLGIGVLVAAAGVGAFVLDRKASLTHDVANALVLAVAGASCLALAALALLWVRDVRRLRGAQGERLLRALQFNCALPDERIAAFKRTVDPTAAFFQCYELWRSESATAGGGPAGRLRGGPKGRSRGTTRSNRAG